MEVIVLVYYNRKGSYIITFSRETKNKSICLGCPRVKESNKSVGFASDSKNIAITLVWSRFKKEYHRFGL